MLWYRYINTVSNHLNRHHSLGFSLSNQSFHNFGKSITIISMKSIISALVMALAIDLSFGAPGLYFQHLPAQQADTKVFRDALGNQQTSYAYHDGHSSAVAVSRSDSNTHLVYPPQVVYETQVAAVAPAVPVAPAIPVAPAAVAAPAFATDYHHHYHGYEPAFGPVPAAPVVYDDYQHLHHHHHNDYYV